MYYVSGKAYLSMVNYCDVQVSTHSMRIVTESENTEIVNEYRQCHNEYWHVMSLSRGLDIWLVSYGIQSLVFEERDHSRAPSRASTDLTGAKFSARSRVVIKLRQRNFDRQRNWAGNLNRA
jgi:hypothetical protein